jgi:hypothetical protein
MGMTVVRLRLSPVGETRFPPRSPFFRARLTPRGAQVAARGEERSRGNLPVPPTPLPPVHGPVAGP